MEVSEGDPETTNSLHLARSPSNLTDGMSSISRRILTSSTKPPPCCPWFKLSNIRRTELNAHVTGRNCCLEWDFRRTIHRFYTGYKQAMNRIDRGQEDVATRMYRLYRDVRKMKRRSRDEKRSQLDFLTRDAAIRDRLRSINTDELHRTKVRSWNRQYTEPSNRKSETDAQLPDVKHPVESDRLPPIVELGPQRVQVDSPKQTEEDATQLESSVMIDQPNTEENSIDRGVIIEWLDVSAIHGAPIIEEEFELPSIESTAAHPPPQPPSASPAATVTTEPVQHLATELPTTGRKISHRSSKPLTYSNLLIKNREDQMVMKLKALSDRPKAYVWNGDHLHQSATQSSQRCQPGRVGARSEFLLKRVPLPKPALSLYPAPTSKELYERKKALDKETVYLHRCSRDMQDLFYRLSQSKDEDGSLAIMKLLTKLNTFTNSINVPMEQEQPPA